MIPLGGLSHFIRRRIVESLQEKGEISFIELLEYTTIKENHGKFGYHLRELKSVNIVEYEPSRKKYRLTESGHLLGEVNWDIRFLTGRKLDFMHQPTRYVRNLGFGEHAILFYDTEDIKIEIAYSFLLAGLLKREAVVYVVSEHKLDSESLKMREYGINISDYGKEAFEVLSSEECYLRKGEAQVETIMANWQRLIEKKRKAGFTGLYVAAEMEAFLNYANAELLRYEETLNSQFPSNECALCLYDTKKIETQFIQLNKSHGHSVFKGIAVKTKQV